MARAASKQASKQALEAYDNRWPGADPESQGHRGTDFVFDFDLPDGKPAKGYVSDAGFGELSIHAAVNPKGDWVRTSTGGFEAGMLLQGLA
jgi:hypothetical protein